MPAGLNTMLGKWLQDGITYYRTRPTGHVSSVSSLQSHLRVDDESDYLEMLLDTATRYAEQYLNLTLTTAELTRQFDMHSERPSLRAEHKMQLPVSLPYGPVTAVDRIYVVDNGGDETDITSYTEDLLSQPARVYLREIVTGRQYAMLRVEYTAGYDGSEPADIAHGVLMHAAYLYEHRGDMDAANAAQASGATSTYGKHRVLGV